MAKVRHGRARASGSGYERELVRLLKEEKIYAVRIAGSGSGKMSDADVFSDAGILFEVKSLSLDRKTQGRKLPYYSLSQQEREKVERLKAMCKEYGLLFLYAIRIKSPYNKPVRSKWYFITLDKLVTTNKGGIHADPAYGSDWGDLSSFITIYKSSARLASWYMDAIKITEHCTKTDAQQKKITA